MKDQKDDETLSEFVLWYEELPPRARNKNKKSKSKPSVLGNDIHDRPADSTDDSSVDSEQKVQRRSRRYSIHYINVNGKKIPVFPPSFFRR